MYKYEEQRSTIFSDEGQRMFLEIRDRAQKMFTTSGAAKLENMISGTSGDTFMMLACIDRLVELGEIKEIPTTGIARAQDRVFVSKR